MATPLTRHDPGVRAELDGHVATVTLDRSQSKNACTGDMWVAIGAAFQEISRTGARVIVLTGANGDFCAGADLGGGGSSAGAASEAPQRYPSMVDSMRVLGDVVTAVHSCPLPVVAKVDGVCVGAGLGLALAADLLWCSDRARFSAIFTKRGLSLDFGTSWFLRQRVPVHVAKELVFTGRMVPAEEALGLGLANAVVPADELDAAVQAVVDAIAAGPPIAIASAKRELDAAGQSSLAQALELETLAQSVNVQTEDMREALTAFMERRTPEFKGR